MTTPPVAPAPRSPDRFRTLLWCAVAALAVSTLGEAWRAMEARADVAAWGSEFSVLTTDIGSEDLVVVLDQRAEQLLLYHVRNQTALEFRGKQSLSELFLEARRASGR